MKIENLTLDDVLLGHENSDVEMIVSQMMDMVITAYMNIQIKGDPSGILEDKKALFEKLINLYIDNELQCAADTLHEKSGEVKDKMNAIKELLGGMALPGELDIDKINSDTMSQYTDVLFEARETIMDFYFG